MRVVNILVVAVAATISLTSAEFGKSRFLKLESFTVNNSGDGSLWSYTTNDCDDSTEAEDEKRAVNFSDVKQWLKKMLESERVQRKMFKRWNSYRMEDIKMKIGESKLNNDDVGVLPPKPPSLLTTLEKCQASSTPCCY
ncbi:hypothetical protein F442_04431 [Phytophthora nicotianae P10297]|uniref:RxLR effector protein n=1 Tax=Phytophthora nicotianae P10297 TaxID=1317064 RepID=W2ZS95_PHYNI|nr:hypothetical protein F442_04431 [Phytophthora nicotianae P10297]